MEETAHVVTHLLRLWRSQRVNITRSWTLSHRDELCDP